MPAFRRRFEKKQQPASGRKLDSRRAFFGEAVPPASFSIFRATQQPRQLKGEENRGHLPRSDLCQSLQVPEGQRRRLASDDSGGLRKLVGCLQLAIYMNN